MFGGLSDVLKQLKANPGIPVRLPAYRHPPFRAEPFRYGWTTDVPNAALVQFAQHWDTVIDATPAATDYAVDPQLIAEAEETHRVPKGVVVYVTRVGCWCCEVVGAAAADPMRQGRWSLQIGDPNGAAVFRGARAAFPESIFGTSGNGASVTAKLANPWFHNPQLPANVRAMPGDRWFWTIANTAAVQLRFYGLVEGYLFPSTKPVSGDAHEISGND